MSYANFASREVVVSFGVDTQIQQTHDNLTFGDADKVGTFAEGGRINRMIGKNPYMNAFPLVVASYVPPFSYC